ncbi:MAG: LssY C-terminal domain-containing protein [Patescibacteria group bacterium]|nr:LssY C-terminal domain-containing protein [Patescibacteria group bacterium]
MDWTSFFLVNLQHFRILGYWVVLLVSLVESLAFVGLVFPGSVLVVLAGFLASRGYFDFGDLFWFAAAGAIIGDAVSFYLGRRGTKLFRDDAKIFHSSHLVRGQRFFGRYGGASVFLGRFVAPLRPVIPFVAGVSGMATRQFFFWNISSALVWSFTHLILGYFFGAAWRTIEVWTTRIGIAAVVAVAFFALLYYLRRFIVRQGREIFGLVRSVARSVARAVATNPEVHAYVQKHPRFFAFARQRFSRREFHGLPLTLLTVAFVYVLFLLLGIMQDILASEPITSVDTRVADLLAQFRDPQLTRLFLWITAWGNWLVAGSITAVATIIFLLRRRRHMVVALWTTMLGSQMFHILGKWVVHRSRPPMALYAVSSTSFPSGHAVIAAALYGFVAFALARSAKTWRGKTNAILGGLVVILVLGFSRLYLGVHYLSDVWGGYLIGLLWLIIGISLAEWYRARPASQPTPAGRISGRVQLITVALVAAELVFVITYATQFRPSALAAAAPQPVVTADLLKVFSENQLPKYTETLTGNQQEPLSFIVTAKDDAALVAAFRRAGWYRADPVNLSTLSALLQAALNNTAYPTAPMTSSFWNNAVQDFGFEKPTAADSVRQRHHARFWRTGYVTPAGELLYAGTASLDTGIKWGITHRIDPNVDAERAFLLSDLQQAGVVAQSRAVAFVPGTLGKNFSGDQFFTDGTLWYVEVSNP